MRSGEGLPLSSDERKRRLLAVLGLWHRQLGTLEASAVVHFQKQDLHQISSLLTEKRRIEGRIARLNHFIKRYLD